MKVIKEMTIEELLAELTPLVDPELLDILLTDSPWDNFFPTEAREKMLKNSLEIWLDDVRRASENK